MDRLVATSGTAERRSDKGDSILMTKAPSRADEPVRRDKDGDHAERATSQGGNVEGEQLVLAEVMQVRTCHIESHGHDEICPSKLGSHGKQNVATASVQCFTSRIIW